MKYPSIKYSLPRARIDMAMVIVLAASLTMFSILATYSASDPGWTHSGSSPEVMNIGGVAGAYMADIGYSLFGSMAFFIPICFGMFGWKYLYRWKRNDKDQLLAPMIFLAGFFLTLIGGCGFENIYGLRFSTHLSSPSGGVLGGVITQSLSNYLPWQVLVSMFLSMSIAGTMLIGLPWMRISELVGKFLFAMGGAMFRKWPDRRKRMAKPSELEMSDAGKTATSKKSSNNLRDKLPKSKKKRRKLNIAERNEPELGSLGVGVDDAPSGMSSQTATPTLKFAAEEKPKAAPQPKAKRSIRGKLPEIALLDAPEVSQNAYSEEDIEKMSQRVEQMLEDFGVEVRVDNARPGPVITQLEVEPAPGIKASQIVNLSRDLARSLSVSSVRVVDNIPGSSHVGIEVPNRTRETVRLFDGLQSRQYKSSASPLTVVLGKDIRGGTVVSSLAKMPHLLIAGTTGAGKSVCLNAILLSFLYKSTPDSLRLIMVDPKMLEFSVYEGIPHLLTPVITDMEKTENALRWCIQEMELRYELMSKFKVRNLDGFNDLVRDSEPIPHPSFEDSDEPVYLTELPFIVVVIDELADLIMVMGRKAEDLIIRIAQRARAAGIHLIVATQRPSTDVIKGLLKANIPTRIGFKVASNADSRTILDQPGAETLLGQGDMLFIAPGTSDVARVHGAFVSDDEVKRVVDHWKSVDMPQYVEDVVVNKAANSSDSGFSGNDTGGEGDEFYDKAVDYVIRQRRPTISSVQRQFRIGYNRAARIIEAMEVAGVVTPADSTGKREVLVPPPQD